MNLLQEISESLQLWRFTLYSSLVKISLRNAGSSLGVLWEVISTFIVSAILASVWIKVLGVKGSFFDYFIYVYIGMVVWGWLSSAVSNLCATLVKNSRALTSRNLPLLSYLFEDMLISSIPFFMSLPFVLFICFANGVGMTFIGALSFMFGCVLILLTSLAFSLSVGLAAFFLGDIRQMITAIMRLSFLVTPVIWKASRLGEYEYVLLLNPFYGYLHILRSSLLGEQIRQQYLIQAVCVTIFLCLLAIGMYSALRGRIQQRALEL